jgi:hypothetical protein
MSTLTILKPQSDEQFDTDARFDSLVRTAVTAPQVHQPEPHQPEVAFETVFDLDYGQPVPALAPRSQRKPHAARRIRVAKAKPSRPVPKAVRMTRRGRSVLVLAFLGLALALMIPFGGWATASLSGGSPEPVRVVEVQPGDTLYGIASDLAEPGQIRAMVHRIQELNSLPGGQIVEGQKLAVPRG